MRPKASPPNRNGQELLSAHPADRIVRSPTGRDMSFRVSTAEDMTLAPVFQPELCLSLAVSLTFAPELGVNVYGTCPVELL